MTVVVERMIAVRIRLEATSMQDADDAFRDLRQRIAFSLPKRRFGPTTLLEQDVYVRLSTGKRLEL